MSEGTCGHLLRLAVDLQHDGLAAEPRLPLQVHHYRRPRRPVLPRRQNGVPDEAVQHGRLACAGVAEGDGVEEGGGAARRRVVGGVVVGEERRGLAHRLGELRQLVHGFHGRRISRDRKLRRRRRPRPGLP
uniref:Uncharacterized protein n=1 Tax=Arundo donax TaxID=35708 RepID=A0A0A9D2D9_ARUDO